MALDEDGTGWSVRNGVGINPIHIEENEGDGVLVPDIILGSILSDWENDIAAKEKAKQEQEYEVATKQAKSSLSEEVRCGVSSCLVYDEDFDGNCGTFYSGDLNKCKRFTQEKADIPTEPKTVTDIAEEKKSCGRKIYF